jgi:hypothetical protein
MSPVGRERRHILGLGPFELAKHGDRLAEEGRDASSHTAPSVSVGEEEHIEKISVGFEPLAGPMAKRAIGVGPRRWQVLDKPRGARRDEGFESFEACGDRIAAVDGEAHVVDECRCEQFLVAWAFLMNELEDLE